MSDNSFKPIIGIRRQINNGPWGDVDVERAERLGALIGGVFQVEKEAAKDSVEAAKLDALLEDALKTLNEKDSHERLRETDQQAPIRCTGQSGTTQD